ncbi:SAM-dependent methyltransferase [Vibrio sp. S17_S38]|uniref:tRNA (adenine(22)-N(1))-methyltransferase n=1 Tax=Vibrio sp. S17_S38 TaxID=2720229 RepID=UPI00168016B2|nr:tRNA (adenine(22)-N(1))-methyltransferase TrmK [Vibrio sp. S17_S38]MBD1572172.1 SAM-dependent methyltransferase [Vibrio sp. S17_S38]
MKLNKRLKQIEQMVTSDYTHIWDCCCDHGFLGAALLSRQAAMNIHFVDIVPELMDKLEKKLHQFYSRSHSVWKTHCLDVATLPLDQYEGKHLIIIAGVGGDLMSAFIQALHKKYPHITIDFDFLLCPVHHQFTLRQQLIKLDFSLKREILIEENKRFYEVLFVSSKIDKNKRVSAVGKDIWKATSAQQIKVAETYLHKTLQHYQRIQKGKTNKVDHILDAYRAIQFEQHN